MHVTSASPLRVASRVWPTARGGWTLTVVCKATYRLQPGESLLLDAQEPVQDEDTYWNDDPTRSLSAATDLAPFKPRADVVLVGSAYAPGQVPARSVVARLILGDLDKSLEAWCDRAWTQDGQLREGARAAKFPLRYERAAGGPESWNPVGVRRDAPSDAYGMVPLPSLQPPGLHITRRDDFIEPIGFGPIAPTWPWRWDRLGRHPPQRGRLLERRPHPQPLRRYGPRPPSSATAGFHLAQAYRRHSGRARKRSVQCLVLDS